MSRSGTIRRLAGRALRRPRLIPTMIGAAWRFRARGWYRRAPFLPLPPAEYLDWRMETAYGRTAGDGGPSPQELERYLGWARRLARRVRRPVVR